MSVAGKITLAVLATVMVVCLAGSPAYASTTLADIRVGVTSIGTIPDTYLIELTGVYWESKNATLAYETIKA